MVERRVYNPEVRWFESPRLRYSHCMSRTSLLGRIAGYRSAASQAHMRARACEMNGEDSQAWLEKEAKWKEKERLAKLQLERLHGDGRPEE